MPEAVELRMGCFGDGGVPVTEADDGTLRWKPAAGKDALPLGALTGRAASAR